MFKENFLNAIKNIEIYLMENNILNKEVSKKNLISLAEEGLKNHIKYPDDKMCRWLGYTSGVIFYTNNKFENFFENNRLRSKFIYKEKLALNNVADHYLCQEKNKYFTDILLKIKSEYNPCNAHFQLGFYQGQKIAQNQMNIRSEREFTRPYFHSYYNQKISTFENEN